MNPDAIEAALMSGKPLVPPSSPPPRDNEPDSDVSETDSVSSSHHRKSRQPGPPPTGPDPQAQPYANAQGRQTGVKGVLDDRRASALASQRATAEARSAHTEEQMKRGMVAMTISEEASARAREKTMQESKEDAEARERWRRARREELEREKERERANEGMGRVGLREVGQDGFLGAVERRGWVVVLIYEPVSPCSTRCR